MNPLPLFDYDLVHQLEAFAPLQAHEPFAIGGKNFLGVQPSAWESSELSWDNGDLPYPQTVPQAGDLRGYGKWHGPGALHAHVGELWLSANGANAASEKLDHDAVAVISEQQGFEDLRLHFEILNPGFIPFSGGVIRIFIQNGNFEPVPQIEDFPLHLRSAGLPPLLGHSIIWARLEGVIRTPQLPPDYFAVRGFTSPQRRFFYVENQVEYYWDYIADVGRRPTEPAHPFYALYNAAFEKGELVHRGEWSQYLTDGAPQNGPWSALRVRVGDTPFAVAPGFLPHPGAALLECTGVATRAPVAVHPLCLSITAGRALEHGPDKGAGRIGGTLASRNGPFTGYWSFDGNTAELLGATALNYVAVCEASLYPVVADLLDVSTRDEFGDVAIERHREFVLSYSHLYEFSTFAEAIEARLPGVPISTLGHPGGRCLRSVDDVVYWLTEFFGGVGKPLGDGEYGQFYNTLKSLDLRAAFDAATASGRGTVFQGHNAAEVFGGRYFGWVQDKSFGIGAIDADGEPTIDAILEGPQQFLATLLNGEWRALSMGTFPAALLRWQRLRAVAHQGGARLLTTGKEARGEAAAWARFDGQDFKIGHLPFRARRLTTCADENGRAQVYALGRFVGDNGDLEARWSVIRLAGDFKEVCFAFDPAMRAFVAARADWESAGGSVAGLPPYLGWFASAADDVGGFWEQWENQPSSGITLQLQTDDATLRYQLPDEASRLVSDQGAIVSNNGARIIAQAGASGLPYDATNVWCRLCLTPRSDGQAMPDNVVPRSCIDSAKTAEDELKKRYPNQTIGHLCLRIEAREWDAFQVNDMGGGALSLFGRDFPILWARFDSFAAGDDLATYRRALRWNATEAAPQPVRSHVDVCVLVAPPLMPVVVPSIDRRDV